MEEVSSVRRPTCGASKERDREWIDPMKGPIFIYIYLTVNSKYKPILLTVNVIVSVSSLYKNHIY